MKAPEAVTHQGESPKKGGAKVRKLINRLVKWLKLQGISNKKIVECIDYITSESKKESPPDKS